MINTSNLLEFINKLCDVLYFIYEMSILAVSCWVGFWTEQVFFIPINFPKVINIILHSISLLT